MITIQIFLFIFLIALILFISGFTYGGRIKYTSVIFFGVSSFLFMFLGILILASGIGFENGSLNITTSGNVSSVVSNYTVLSGGFNSYGLSYIFIFIGLLLSLYTYLGFMDSKDERREFSEEEAD